CKAVTARVPVQNDKSKAARRILIVEDHPINQELICALVGNLGIAFDLAVDGVEAVEMVEKAAAESRYELVLMDIQMPRRDGFAATREIRNAGHLPEDLPIVALTANAFGDDIEKCLEAGMQDHLAKPINASKLQKCLAQWLPTELAPAKPKAISAVEKMRPKFELLKEQVNAAARDWLEATEDGEDGNIEQLRMQLHQIAGVAALFGDREIGTLAMQSERYFSVGRTSPAQQSTDDDIGTMLRELIRLTEFRPSPEDGAA
ncbi:MAG: response regulator, partial [Alteraurantiacibacter sp.]